MGPRTSTAIARFERGCALPETGEPSPLVMAAAQAACHALGGAAALAAPA